MATAKRGDIIVMSATPIMEAFNATEVLCTIDHVRHYREPNNRFSLVGYICAPAQDPNMRLLLVERTVGTDVDAFLYRYDRGCTQAEAAPFILNPEASDFLPSFVFTQEGPEGPFDVTWEKLPQGTFFGIDYSDEHIRGPRAICDFVRENGERLFIDWATLNQGWFDIWVGFPLKSFEYSITPSATPF